MTDPAVVLRVVNACSALVDLDGWAPVGTRMEAARAALAGEGGLDLVEIAALERWAARWSSLRPDLRAFYRALAPTDRTADVALRRIFYGGPPLAGWQYGILSRKWEAATGRPPSFEMVPAPRREG